MVPLQQSAMTTTLARKTPFSLLAALCPFGKAWGSLFLDDGEQVELSSFLSVSYVVQVQVLYIGLLVFHSLRFCLLWLLNGSFVSQKLV